MSSTWIVTFSLGWDPLSPEERQELERHFSSIPSAVQVLMLVGR